MSRIRQSIIVSSLLGASLAHGLMLGGTQVPKEKVVVYVMIGHSNMAGMDPGRSDGTTHPRAWTYQLTSTKTWVLAKETPGNLRNGLNPGQGSGGPSMPLLKQMAAAYPDYHFGILINASQSSTCRGENTGNNNSGLDPEDNRYWKGARLYEEIVTAVKAVQADVTLGGIICMLGSVEATRTTEATCRNFSNDLAQLARDLRADLNSPLLPFIMGEYENGAAGNFKVTLPMPAIIDAEIRLLPTKLENSATINSAGIAMLDDHHYSGNVGQPEFAKRTVAAIQAKKWFPPPISTLSINTAPGRSPKTERTRLEFLPSLGVALAGKGGHLYLIDGSHYKLERNHAIPSF